MMLDGLDAQRGGDVGLAGAGDCRPASEISLMASRLFLTRCSPARIAVPNYSDHTIIVIAIYVMDTLRIDQACRPCHCTTGSLPVKANKG